MKTGSHEARGAQDGVGKRDGRARQLENSDRTNSRENDREDAAMTEPGIHRSNGHRLAMAMTIANAQVKSPA